jgi:hypothetical protein
MQATVANKSKGELNMDKAISRKINIIEGVASRIAQRRPELSQALREVSAQMQAVPFAGGDTEALPKVDGTEESPDAGTEGFSEAGTPPKVQIEKFVRSKDRKRSHKATVTFLAPINMSESDIMEFIMGIRKLGVDVEGFQWSVTDAKADRGE